MDEINQLKREGLSILAIGNLTGYDRKTIRKYLLGPAARPVYGLQAAPESKLEPFKAYLGERLQGGEVEVATALNGSACTRRRSGVTKS